MATTTAEYPSYRRPWWLPNSHLETIWAKHVSHKPDYTREVISTFDNDVIALDFLLGRPDLPAVTLFHGLEGCSRTHTVAHCARFFHTRGWSVFAPHFRTCGGVMNRLPRAYHAGDSKDIDWMLKYVEAATGRSSARFAVGVSLGGNALAKWLGENPGQRQIAAAATVCAPYDLQACSSWINRPLNHLVYERYFLKSLRDKMRAKTKQYPALASAAEIGALRTIRQFDERFTAPLHGFDGADDYYRRASALPVLAQVATPLLSVQSDNDALVPVTRMPANDRLHTVTTRGGGHAGYVSSPFPGTFAWLTERIGGFFAQAA